MLELLHKTNIDFIGKKYITLIVTGTLTIIGIIAIIQIASGKANMGIDFAGGTEIQLRFEKPVSLQSVRSALETGGIKGFELQDIPAENKVLIKTKQSEGDLSKISDSITAVLNQSMPDNKYIIDSTTA